MPTLSVSKWEGTGNDFVLLDAARAADYDLGELARTICDRRLSVGADGLIVLGPPAAAGADVAMRIFNADGSEAQACGNGARCVALARANGTGSSVMIETKAGVIGARVLDDGQVRVDMGRPRFLRREIPMAGPPDAKGIGVSVELGGRPLFISAVSLGNPHCVIFSDEDPDAVNLDALATALADESLFPEGVNVEVARRDGDAMVARVHERGVGETLGCGTGACAIAICAIFTGKIASPAIVRMPGGTVSVEWDGEQSSAFLTGPARRTFVAEVDI